METVHPASDQICRACLSFPAHSSASSASQALASAEHVSADALIKRTAPPWATNTTDTPAGAPLSLCSWPTHTCVPRPAPGLEDSLLATGGQSTLCHHPGPVHHMLPVEVTYTHISQFPPCHLMQVFHVWHCPLDDCTHIQ